MKKNSAEFWYAINECENGIVQIHEPWIDRYLAGNCWFIRGTKQSLLIDTGTGMVPLKPILDALSEIPILALSCNCFYDHAGGLHGFNERACHSADVENMLHPTLDSSVVSYYVDEAMLTQLPHENFELSAYRMRSATPTRILNDGDVIDLGNRQFQVIHVPGVTPGSIAIWEPATGSLFTGDTLYDDPLHDSRSGEEEDHIAYCASLKTLSALPVNTVYPGHFGRFNRSRMDAIIKKLTQGSEN